ncbi:hypothetical protein Purlil1_13667 [Purpureocillium lilacinum]|uniref:MYB DNA-binding domain-containing protein n=1 Tax=Purpureocillium lilacinum TaxID=33203 RepID=A0ABR0BDF3_PURLI|nr:hypothetical protein Purlil1_13667 [Purpureocillium lilacinum]
MDIDVPPTLRLKTPTVDAARFPVTPGSPSFPVGPLSYRCVAHAIWVATVSLNYAEARHGLARKTVAGSEVEATTATPLPSLAPARTASQPETNPQGQTPDMDISLLLSYRDSHGPFQDAQQQQQTSLPPRLTPLGSASEQLPGPLTRNASLPHVADPPSNAPPSTISQTAPKLAKWSQEEDSLIIELRGSGMKWEDVSKRLPGRSAVACRLHYQNYLERRSEWDEERKNKLARLYERFKAEMWAKVAEELQVPWRAAEAMHWQLGEVDIARRAGVVPFSLTSSTAESTAKLQAPGPTAYLQHQNRGPHYPAPSSSRSEYAQPRYQVNSLPPRPPLPPPPALVPAPEFIPTSSGEQEQSYYTTGPSPELIWTQGQPHPGLPPSPVRFTTATRPYPDWTELPTYSDSNRAVPPPPQRRLPPKRPSSPSISRPRNQRRRIA